MESETREPNGEKEVTQGDPDVETLEIIYTSTADNSDVKKGDVVLLEEYPKSREKESADEDAEMPGRREDGLIDASTQTIAKPSEEKPSDVLSDVGTFRKETVDGTEMKTTTPNNQLDKAPAQLKHAFVQTLSAEEAQQRNAIVQTLVSGLFSQSDVHVQTEEIESMVLDSDIKTIQEPSELEHEKHLQSDIQKVPSNTSDISDLTYFEKEQCPCKMPRVKKYFTARKRLL